MKSNIFKKSYEFGNRHLLLSAYICLMLMSICVNFYWAFYETRESIGSLSTYSDVVTVIFYDLFFFTALDAIPVFLIASFFYYCLTNSKKRKKNISFYKQYVSSFIPSFLVALFFITVYFSALYGSAPIFFALICSTIYSFFFCTYSNTPAIETVIISFFINLIMGPIYQMYLLAALFGGV